MHVAPRLEQLETDLATGLAAADDQHTALRKVAGVAVGRGVQLHGGGR